MLLLVITMEQTPIVTPIDNACVYKMPVSNFRNKLRTIRRLWLDQFLNLFIADFKLNLKLSAPTLSAYEQASLVLEQTERLSVEHFNTKWSSSCLLKHQTKMYIRNGSRMCMKWKQRVEQVSTQLYSWNLKMTTSSWKPPWSYHVGPSSLSAVHAREVPSGDEDRGCIEFSSASPDLLATCCPSYWLARGWFFRLYSLCYGWETSRESWTGADYWWPLSASPAPLRWVHQLSCSNRHQLSCTRCWQVFGRYLWRPSGRTALSFCRQHSCWKHE